MLWIVGAIVLAVAIHLIEVLWENWAKGWTD